MPLRSMTGFAQVKGALARDGAAGAAFSVSLKSVNHRFLDLHLRLPSESDALEMKLRRLLKEKLARGHVEITVALDRGGDTGLTFNRELVGGYIAAFRAAAARDIQEGLVRMPNPIEHFLGLLSAGGEIGKKLDFLLQEMNREANTLLSKTSGVVGEALRLTELGLAMKSEIEKCREQAQNI